MQEHRTPNYEEAKRVPTRLHGQADAKHQLRLAADISAKRVQPLLKEADELVAIFTTSVKRLRLTLTAGLIGLAVALTFCLSYFHF